MGFMGFVPNAVPPLRNQPKAVNTKPETLKLRTANTTLTTPTNMAMEQAKPEKVVSKKRTKRKEKSNGGGKTYIPLPFDFSSDDSSSGGESFNREVKRTLFYDDKRTAKVSFDVGLNDTTTTMPLETTVASTAGKLGPKDSKLYVNLATFSRSNVGSGNSVSGYPIYDYYNVIYSQMAKVAMSVIQSKLIDVFTFTNFYNYIHTLVTSLELYYHVDAILSYSSNTDDKNSGIIELQRKLTEADVFTAQNELRRALKGYWFPEKYAQLIRWTYQIYKTSDLYQAPNYIFSPLQVTIYNDSTYDLASQYVGFLNAFSADLTSGPSTNTYSKLSSVLGKVWPGGVIRGFPLSANTAHYDPNHYEIFCNQPVWVQEGNSAPFIYPSGDLNTQVVYARNCDPGERSGLPFVLQNIDAGSGATIDFFKTLSFSIGADPDFVSNKYVMVAGTANDFAFYPRNNYQMLPTQVADVHIVDLNRTTDTAQSQTSCAKSGFQRVYFDSAAAPLINIKTFMDIIFDFI